MRITIVGLGYVGMVCGLCLANSGHKVIGVEVQQDIVDLLNVGKAPITEPGISELLEWAQGKGCFRATTTLCDALKESEMVLVCVGTPPLPNGLPNMSFVFNAMESIGRHLHLASSYPVIAIRSTVPVGTLAECSLILEQTSGLKAGSDFGVGLNPEFLREGSAVQDFTNPPFILVNREDERVADRLTNMYGNIPAPVLRVSSGAAEMIKYVSNAFHAMKVTFANEVGAICKAVNIDGREVMEVFCQDKQLNLSDAYLKPGFAYGGSCLSKDLEALIELSRRHDVQTNLLDQIAKSNAGHIHRTIEMIEDLGNQKLGFLGLSFKSCTNDLRESPTVHVVQELIERGFEIRVFDPNIYYPSTDTAFTSHSLKDHSNLAGLITNSVDELLEFSETIIVTYNNDAFHGVLDRLNEKHSLVDLTSLPGSGTSTGQYHGVCW